MDDDTYARLSGLGTLTRAAAGSGSAGAKPVDEWNPPYCGDIGLKIRRDGVWLYQDSPIERPAIVKLFASILRKDADGRTYLVTPVEKVDVEVEDAPFLAVEMKVEGSGRQQVLTFRTNVGDVVTVDKGHPLRFECQEPGGGLKPYILVRGRLEALATRSVSTELALLAEEREGGGAIGVWSAGEWWEMV